MYQGLEDLGLCRFVYGKGYVREQVYQLLIGFRYLGLICQRRKKCRLSSAILQVMTIKKVFNFTSCGAANQLRNTVKVIYSCELGGESIQK